MPWFCNGLHEETRSVPDAEQRARSHPVWGYELDSIAAGLVEHHASAGRGSVMGTVIGCQFIGVLNNGLFLLNVSPFWQQVVKGFVILAAVAIDRMSQRDD